MTAKEYSPIPDTELPAENVKCQSNEKTREFFSDRGLRFQRLESRTCRFLGLHGKAVVVAFVLITVIFLNVIMRGDWTRIDIMNCCERRERRLPNCIIVGVRKCGTRALLEFLNVHPQIRIASEEIHYFDVEDNYKRGLDWYRSRMPLARPDDIVIEKTPGYFIKAEAPGRIRKMNKDIKLLLIVRNPVTRILSDYTQVLGRRKSKNLTFPSFEEQTVDSTTGEINLDYRAIRTSIYHRHFRLWLKSFHLAQIHIVDGEKLIKDSLPELAKIEDYLGLDHRLTSDHFYFNKTRGFYCMRNSTHEHCLGPTKGRKHPDVSHDVLDKLHLFLTPHNRLFFRQTGRTFDWS